MSNTFKDHFSTASEAYSQYRPGYPQPLFDFLASLAPQRELAWDCATGNGQAARELAGRFARVIATDASPGQIEAATPYRNVEYRVAVAEQSGIESQSVDLVTVAQALHWLALDGFYAEVKRVLKPKGVIAVWSYNLLRIDDESDRVIDHLYHDLLKGYWPVERRLVEQGYEDLRFPFASPTETLHAFHMEATWNLNHLLGYLSTWSAVKLYEKDHGEDPVSKVAPELKSLWGSPDEMHKVTWPLSLRVGINTAG